MDIIIKALAERVKAGEMTIEQVPLPYQEKTLKLIEDIQEDET